MPCMVETRRIHLDRNHHDMTHYPIGHPLEGRVARLLLVPDGTADPAEVGLAGTQMSSSIYGTVVFDLTFFNEVTRSDNILKSIEANVIDSCIEVIIGLPDIRSHRLVHRIPSYFDSEVPHVY